MGVPIRTILAHRSNYGGMRKKDPENIVIHYTAGDGDHDENNAKYFQNPNIETSAHDFVDDDSITHSVPYEYVAWSVGGRKYYDCAQTGGGKMYGIVTNDNSINIEMCDTVKDGKLMATEKTMENAAALCRMLMHKYNIDINHVVRHFDVNGKHCPVYFMDKKAWKGFKNRLKPVFKEGKTYKTTQSCYLRVSAGTGNNKAPYKLLSMAMKLKCSKKDGVAIMKKGQRFTLRKIKFIGVDMWGQVKSGYWVPLVYDGKQRAHCFGRGKGGKRLDSRLFPS